VQEMFLAGVSTRRVGQLLDRIIGQSVSAGTVSRITRKLDKEVKAWHSPPVQDTYVYVIFDAVYLKARWVASLFRTHRRSRKCVVLVAYGICHEGFKELIDFRLARGESAACWKQFLWSLFQRGLRADTTVLMTSDGGRGILAALEDVYPLVPKQRCWFHKMQNVANFVRKKDRSACVHELRGVYQAPNRRQALRRFQAWADRWRNLYAQAVDCLERDLEALLAFFQCPEPHRRMVRTTNAIERCFREVRRRTNGIGCFMDDGSVGRLVYAIFQYLNHKRAGQVCKEFKATPQTA